MSTKPAPNGAIRRALDGVHCPGCGLRCVLNLSSDYAECPDHGRISGLLMLEIKGMAQWEAVIEIKCSQLRDFVRWRFRDLEMWIYNDSKLRIRVPH